MVQREGRILRKGNQYDEVEIYRYICEGSFDAYSWQILESKQKFISQFLIGSSYQREASDLEDNVLTYAEVKALALSDPRMKTLAESRIELANLRIINNKYIDTKNSLKADEETIRKGMPGLDKQIRGTELNCASLENRSKDDYIIATIVDNDQFEKLVKCYFNQIGADFVYIPNKKNGEGEADADVIARFDSLKIEICVQVKHHEETTGQWAVTQISEYMEQGEKYQEADDPSYTSIAWVISSGKDFSDEAYESAMTRNVRLINGAEFRQMLVDAGMSKMIFEFGKS